MDDYREQLMGAQDYSASGAGYEGEREHALAKVAFGGETWRQQGGYQDGGFPSGFHPYQPSPFDYYPQYTGPPAPLPSFPSTSYPSAQYGAVLSQTLEVVRGPYGQYSETRRMTTHLPTGQPAAHLPAVQPAHPLTNEFSQQLAGSRISSLADDQLMQPYPQMPALPPPLQAAPLPALLPPGPPPQPAPLLPESHHAPPPLLPAPHTNQPPTSPYNSPPSEVLPGFSLSVVEQEEGPEVVLQGDGCMFIQAVHKASLDFLKTHKVPFPIFAKIILRKRKEEVQRFLQRTNWDKLELGEQLLYAKLYKWLGQPVQLRLERLRVDGTNTTTVKKTKRGILKKDSMEKNEKGEVEQDEEVMLNPGVNMEAAITEVEKHPKKQTRLRKKLLQPRLSPKEGHTSAEQRKQIREWSQNTVGLDKDGIHSKEQKEGLASQLHLPLAVINRVIRYDSKISREQGRQVSTRSLGARSASLNLENNHQLPSNLENHQELPSNLENHHSSSPGHNLEKNHQTSSPGTNLGSIEENQSGLDNNCKLEDQHLQPAGSKGFDIDKDSSHEKSKRLHQKIENLKSKHENQTNNFGAENILSSLQNSNIKNENSVTNNHSKLGNEEQLLKSNDDNVLEAWSYPVGDDLEPSGGLEGILHDEMELLKSLEEEKLATQASSGVMDTEAVAVKEEEIPWDARLPPPAPPGPLPYQSPDLLAPPFAFPHPPPVSQPSPPLDARLRGDLNTFPANSEEQVEEDKVFASQKDIAAGKGEKTALGKEAAAADQSLAFPSFPSSPLPPPQHDSSPPLDLSPPLPRTNSPHPKPPFTTLPWQGNPSASNNNNNDNNSYNIIACESYFKTKPSPSEEEISLFIDCMKVPIEVVKRYLSTRKVRGKEAGAMEEGVKGQKVVLRPYRVVSRPLNFSSNQIQKSQLANQEAQPTLPAALPGEERLQANQPAADQIGQNQLRQPQAVAASLQPMDAQPTIPEPVKPTQPYPLASPLISQPPISNQSQKPTSLFPKTFVKPLDEQKTHQTKLNPAVINKQPAAINQILRLQRRPAVEQVRKELTQIFGEKIFCTLEDLKPLAPCDPLALKKIYEDMSRQGKVQVVSEEFCRGLAANNGPAGQPHRAPARQQPPAQHPPQQQAPPPTYPQPSLLPPQNALLPTSPLSAKYLSDPGNGQVSNSDPIRGEENEYSRKRSPTELETDRLMAKKIKVEEEEVEDEKDDSGYLTNLDASSLNLGEASFNNMIKENVGEVNMLDDSLGLLDLSNMDIVDNMFDQLPEERTHDDMDTDGDDKGKVKIEMKEEVMGDLRRLFFERGVTGRSLSVSVVNVKQGFKKNILEVELSDGLETSTNFFFKILPDSEELTRGLRVRLTSMGCIGARICVDAFEILGKCDQSDLGSLPSIEDDFYVKLRSGTLEDRHLFDIPAPKSLNDYIELEEAVLHYIAGHGGKVSPLKTLFSLSSSSAPLSSRLAKLLATHLGMSRAEVEAYLEKRQPQPVVALLHDHDYCDLPSLLA